MELEVKIRGLMMDPVTNMPVVVLKETQGSGILPIWVGIYEANAIALEIEKVQTPRPMTHDLLKNMLTGLNVHVQKVVVSDLKDDTFYALIWMEREGQMMSMDSRPSDALALALRLDCPIFVEDQVLEKFEDGQRGLRKKLERRASQVARESERRGPRPLQDVDWRHRLRNSAFSPERSLQFLKECPGPHAESFPDAGFSGAPQGFQTSLRRWKS